MTEKWKDAEYVNELYHNEGMSGPEIADKLGCSVKPIYERIDEVRSISEANKNRLLTKPASFATSKRGYERSRTKVDGDVYSIAIHRLVAVADYGIEAIKGNIVHHKNNIPWDNRPENLQLMSQSEHVREHLEEIPPHEKAAIYALVESGGLKTDDIGEMFGLKKTTVTTIAKRIRDGEYDITEATA